MYKLKGMREGQKEVHVSPTSTNNIPIEIIYTAMTVKMKKKLKKFAPLIHTIGNYICT